MLPNKQNKLLSQTQKNCLEAVSAVLRASIQWDNPFKSVGNFLTWGPAESPLCLSSPIALLSRGCHQCPGTWKVSFLPFSINLMLGPCHHPSSPIIHSTLPFLIPAFRCQSMGAKLSALGLQLPGGTPLCPHALHLSSVCRWLWVNPWAESDGARILNELPICSLKYKTPVYQREEWLKNVRHFSKSRHNFLNFCWAYWKCV